MSTETTIAKPVSDSAGTTVTDKPLASANDFAFYESESDEVPINGPLPASTTETPAISTTAPVTRLRRHYVPLPEDTTVSNDPPITVATTAPLNRPRRAAADANPYVGTGRTNPYLVGKFKSGLEGLNDDLAGHAPARVVGGARQANAVAGPSAKALGKRKAIDDDTTEVSKKHRLTDHFLLKSNSKDKPFCLDEEEEEDEEEEGDEEDADTSDEVVTAPKKKAVRRIKKRTAIVVVDTDEEEETPSTSPDSSFAEGELEGLAGQDYSKRKPYGQGRDDSHKTDDVRTIFTKIHVKENGRVVAYAKCLVCWNDGNPRGKQWKFSVGSGVSTKRKHISRTKGHYEIYAKRCEEQGIATHERAKPPKGEDSDNDGMHQQTIGFEVVPKSVPFSKEALIRKITEVVVTDDQAFRFSDVPSVRSLLTFLRPGLQDCEIPHRTTITQEIISQANYATVLMTCKFSKVDSLISLTHDLGESPRAKDPYCAISASWIAGAPTDPKAWRLYTQCLAFKPVVGRHTGETISNLLYKVFESYGITAKIGWPVGDNAAVNDKVVRLLGRRFIQELGSEASVDWKRPKMRQGRCLEHQLNLSVIEIIDEISPSFRKTFNVPVVPAELVKKDASGAPMISEDEGQTDSDDDADMPDLVDDDSDNEDDEDENKEDEEDEELEDTSAYPDMLRKMLGLIRTLKKATQARKFFLSLCETNGVNPRQFKLFVKTRFSSLFDALEVFFYLKPALKNFFLLADEEECVPKLAKGRRYADFRLFEDEWSMMAKLMAVLKPVALACQSFSSDELSGLYRALPVLEFIVEQWDSKLEDPEYALLHAAIEAGRDNLLKWYRKMDDTDIYIVTLVLHPRYKLKYINSRWSEEDSSRALKAVTACFDRYTKKSPLPTSAMDSEPIASTSAVAAHADNNYGVAWMESVLASSIQEEPSNPRDELNRYLAMPREVDSSDVVGWWGHHQDEFPILSRMAKDYLAIPSSSTASERLFSSAGHIGTIHRTRILPRNFEAVQILKSAYKVGDITSAMERK